MVRASRLIVVVVALALAAQAAPLSASAGASGVRTAGLSQRLTQKEVASSPPRVAPLVPRKNARQLGANLPLGIGVGTNILVSPNNQHVYDTTAAAFDPSNHTNFSLASIDESDLPLGAAWSSDAGLTWSTSPPPLPAHPPNDFAAEPALAYNAAGNLYGAEIGVAASSTAVTTQLVVSNSPDHGRTWRTP